MPVTNVHFDDETDRKLRTIAAMSGTSKRKLVADVTSSWLKEHDMRETISRITDAITRTDMKNEYMSTLERFLARCRDYFAELFNIGLGKTEPPGKTQEYLQEIAECWDTFCRICPGLEKDVKAEELALAVVKRTFETRVR